MPGHEVVGRVDAIGPGVAKWTVGQRVGVGFFGGEDGVCEACRHGDFVNCQNPVIPGITVDGGYAEMMIADSRGLAAIPDDLTSVEAAPLLCAGITTYNPAQGGSKHLLMQLGWPRLNSEYAQQFGIETPNWPPKAAQKS